MTKLTDKIGRNEPVRRNLLPAAAVVAASTFLGLLAVADPLTVQAGLLAGSVALGEVATVAFGVTRARDQAWGPQSAERLISAEAVLRHPEIETVLDRIRDGADVDADEVTDLLLEEDERP